MEIKKNKRLWNTIKRISIKESIYSNKAIPFSWKKKLNYKNELLNILSKDNNFLSYISSSPPKNNFVKYYQK